MIKNQHILELTKTKYLWQIERDIMSQEGTPKQSQSHLFCLEQRHQHKHPPQSPYKPKEISSLWEIEHFEVRHHCDRILYISIPFRSQFYSNNDSRNREVRHYQPLHLFHQEILIRTLSSLPYR